MTKIVILLENICIRLIFSILEFKKKQQKDDIINLNDTCDHDSFQTFNSSVYVKVMKYSTSRYFVGVKYVLDGIQNKIQRSHMVISGK